MDQTFILMDISDITPMVYFIIGYLLVINFITFFIYGLDKAKSSRNARRISEKTLWTAALVGGSIGALVGMKIFRHKTKKISFQAPLAIILALQILLVYLIFKLNF